MDNLFLLCSHLRMIRNKDISTNALPCPNQAARVEPQDIGVEIMGRPCFQPEHKAAIPLFAHSIAAGFPSPAEDWVENIMDMNELLIKRPAATFLLRVRGDSMIGAGIFEGDILLVDRSITPHEEHVVIAAHCNELTVKRLRREKGRLWLVAENPAYKPILVTEDVSIWGVVTSAIRRF